MATTEEVNILLKIGSDLAGIQRASVEFSKFTTQLKAGFNLNIGSRLADAVLGIPSSVISSVKAYTQQSEQMVREIEKTRAQTGLAAEASQTFFATLRAGNQDIAALTPGLNTLSRVIGEALSGNTPARSKLAQLGLDATALKGLAPERQLEAVAVALSRVTDANRRDALASDVLGKNYAALKPVLDGLASQGFDRLRESVRQTNGLIGDDLSRAIDAAGNRSQSAGTRIAAAMAPTVLVINKLSAAFKELLADAAGAPAKLPNGQDIFASARKQITEVRSDDDIAALRARLVREASESVRGRDGRYGQEKQSSLLAAVELLDRIGKLQVEQNRAADEGAKIDAERGERAIADRLANEAALARIPALRAAFQTSRITELEGEERLNALYGERLRILNEIQSQPGGSEPAQLEKSLQLSIKLQEVREQIKATEKQIADDRIRADEKTKSGEARRAELARSAADAQLGRNLASIEQERARIENDRFTTAVEKQRLLAPLYEREQELLRSRVALLREELALTGDEAARQSLQGRIDTLEGRSAGVTAAQTGNTELGFGDQFDADLTALQDRFGTTTQAISGFITDGIGTALQGVSDGIYGLITGTATWGQVALQAGAQILKSLINIGVQQAALHIAGLVQGKVAAQSQATNNAQIAASAAPAAAATSISSYGAAAVVGTLAAVVGIAAIIALLSKGFADGGYTGPGGKYEPAGIVHAGEYVLPASVVQRIGLANVQALHYGRGYADGGLVSVDPATFSGGAAGGMGGGSERPMNLNIFLSEEQLRDSVYNSEGEALVVDIMRRNWSSIAT